MWLWLKLFGRAPAWPVALGAVIVALVTAGVCAELITTVVRRSLAPRRAGDSGSPRARTTVRVVRLLLLIILTVVFIPPVLDLFGQPMNTGLRLRTLVDWLLGSGLKVLFISTFAYVLIRVIDLATNR